MAGSFVVLLGRDSANEADDSVAVGGISTTSVPGGSPGSAARSGCSTV